MSRLRNWCFTLNNPTENPQALLKELDDDPRVRYAVFQEEKGENETTHYQGYVEFSVGIRFNAMQRLIPRAHLEGRRGTADQARDYCMKDDSRQAGPWECGNFKTNPGNRTDLLEAIKTADETYSIAEVARQHPLQFVKFNRGLGDYIFHTRPRRSIDNPPSVHLYFGPTGTGKTRKAFEDNQDSIFRKPPDTAWFDGYYGQHCLLLDDFAGRASKMSLVNLLQLLDRYPIDVQIKGGHAAMTARHIVITTNLHPVTWYDYTRREEQYKALQRRITSIYVFKGKLGALRVTHKTFFDEWFEGCDQDTLFFTNADAADPISISDSEEELSELFGESDDAMPLAQPPSDDECWVLPQLNDDVLELSDTLFV